MKNLIAFFLFILCFPQNIFCQSDTVNNSENNIYLNAISSSESLNSIAPIDKIINANLIANDSLMMEVYFYKIRFLTNKAGLFKEKTDRKSESFRSNVTRVLNEYDYAISNIDCFWKINFEYNKYNFLEDLINSYEDELDSNLIMEYRKSYFYLERKGLRPDRDGVGLTISYSNGKSNWFGVGFSIFQAIVPTFTLDFNCKGVDYYYKGGYGFILGKSRALQIPLGAKLLTFGYGNAMNKNLHDFSFSFFELNSPIFINPTKIGFQTGEYIEKNEFYYRPSIGLGYGPISISYSYNIPIINKSNQSERGIINLNLSYPITNHRRKIDKHDRYIYENYLQTQQNDKEVFSIVDIMPVFPGCVRKSSELKRRSCTTKKIYNFLSKNTQYPENLKNKNYTGTVYVQFYIDEVGNVVDEEIVQSFPDAEGHGFDREVLKAVRRLPQMEPGMAQGVPQKVQYYIPVKFK